VRRNRARRRLREAYRVARDTAPPGIDAVVIARARALETPLTDLVREMREAFATIPGGGRS
jgi:ribonuclease P protein component